MKISELIKELQQRKDMYGDIDVVVLSSDLISRQVDAHELSYHEEGNYISIDGLEEFYDNEL